MDDEEPANNIKVKVEKLTKIFGPKESKILKLVKKGCSRQDIFDKTEHLVALNNISFEVYEGETFVIMGLSGSGKSTLLRCLNRLIKPTAGTIHIGNEELTGMDNERLIETRRKKMGMVFQNFALLPHRNILDNAAFGLEIQGIPAEEREKKAKEALHLVGLEGYEESWPEQLSGGMKQRVGLARALASSPEILLMDEAFSALDPLIRRDMQDELINIQERLNKTIIFVTHDLDEALKLGDRIALMKEGEIVQIGTAEEILTSPENEYVEQFVENVDMSKVLTAQDIMKRPEPLVGISSGPHVALHHMKEYGISSIYVVGKNRRLIGIITVEEAIKVAHKRKSFEEAIIKDCPRVSPDTLLSEIIPLIAESPYPIAVTGPENRMEGIIVRGLVLAGLGRIEVEE